MCVIWGIPYLLIRVAVRDVEPGTLLFLRTGIGGLILLPLALRRGGFGPVLRRWRWLLAFTVIEMGIPWLFLSDAERKLSSSVSGLLVAAVPLVGVLVAHLTKSEERFDRWQLAGLVLGLAGVGMLVGLDFSQVSTGALLEVLVVVIGYATAPVIMARRLSDLPAIPVVSASLLLVAIGYLPYAAFHRPSHPSAHVVESVATLAVVCTAVAFVVFFALVAEIGPSRGVIITYVNPAVAVLLGVTLLSEKFTLGMGIGFPLILAGSVLGARRKVEAVVQSIATEPDAVSNVAVSSPVPSSVEAQSTSIPSSG